MGLIQRQSIKYSAVSVIGILVGALSTIFIYKLDEAFYGTIQFVVSMANLLFPILSIGATSLVVRFFPDFKDTENRHNGFLGFVFLLAFVGIGLWLVIYPFLKSSIFPFLENLNFDMRLLEQYEFIILGIAIALLLNLVLTNYSSVFGRIVIPRLLNDFILTKILIPVLVLLHLYTAYTEINLFYLMLLIYAIVFLMLIAYVIHLKEFKIRPNFSFLTKQRLQLMGSYASYGVVATMGGMLAVRIDNFMVTSLIDETTNGQYNILGFMANAINFPLMALTSIGAPIIAEKIKSEDWNGVKLLYQRTSINGMVAGLLIFVGVLSNLEDLLSFMNKYEELSPLILVFVFLGLARLFDLITSLNTQIILYSKYYRFNLIVVLFLALANILNNYLFIQILGYGAVGAALSTFISVFAYNLIKLIFIWWKFDMIPVSKSTFLLVLVALVTLLIGYIIPLSFSPVLNMLVRSAVVVLLYVLLLLRFDISKDFENLVNAYWDKLMRRSK